MTEPIERKSAITRACKWIAREAFRAIACYALNSALDDHPLEVIKEVMRRFHIDL
jgi:hypothetical protein